MNENVADITLERIRRVDAKLDRLLDYVIEMKTGMTLLEQQVANLGSQISNMAAQVAHTNNRIDRLEMRVERIERRLDLFETA